MASGDQDINETGKAIRAQGAEELTRTQSNEGNFISPSVSEPPKVCHYNQNRHKHKRTEMFKGTVLETGTIHNRIVIKIPLK